MVETAVKVVVRAQLHRAIAIQRNGPGVAAQLHFSREARKLDVYPHGNLF